MTRLPDEAKNLCFSSTVGKHKCFDNRLAISPSSVAVKCKWRNDRHFPYKEFPCPFYPGSSWSLVPSLLVSPYFLQIMQIWSHGRAQRFSAGACRGMHIFGEVWHLTSCDLWTVTWFSYQPFVTHMKTLKYHMKGKLMGSQHTSFKPRIKNKKRKKNTSSWVHGDKPQKCISQETSVKLLPSFLVNYLLFQLGTLYSQGLNERLLLIHFTV